MDTFVEITEHIKLVIRIMIAIILAHPWHGSFNNAILDAITAQLDTTGRSYEVVDLHKDNFNPVLTESELSLYANGEYSDPLVGKYQDILTRADEVVFIFPIWWSTMPAMLKGWLDKVMLVNFSHNYTNGWTPLLDIQKTVVVTTSQSPTEKFASAIQGDFINNGLAAVGFQNAQWLNCDNVGFGTDEYRQEFITRVVEAI